VQQTRGHQAGDGYDEPTGEQHSILQSVVLHLIPGAALTVFIVLAAPAIEAMGFPPMFSLFVGIGVVIAPIELGILFLHAKQTTGTFSLAGTVTYRQRIPARRLALLTLVLLVWFMVPFIASTVFLDDWLAENVFGWMPEAILQFSRIEEGDPLAAWRIAVMLIVMYAFNGFVGPVVEELYFRGFLLPRISRLGTGAPVLNTVLFSAYHFWTPWQNPARILGFLPIAWLVQRHRSVQIGLAAHVTINVVFLTLLVAVLLSGAA